MSIEKTGMLVSINPPYTDMILSGEKPMEFRNKILNFMLSNHRSELPMYIYETKNKGGCGKVVGEARVTAVYNLDVNNGDSCTAFCRMEACLKDLYRMWKSYHGFPMWDSCKEPWFYDNDFAEYKSRIGWNAYERAFPSFSYAVKLQYVRRYAEPVNISNYLNKTGEPMQKPPQNMCYTYGQVQN